MRILFATSECAPFSKSGGLADVAYSLPPALKAAGDEVAVITPLYRCVRENYGDELVKVGNCTVYLGATSYTCGLYYTESCGVRVWFVEYNWFFDRDRLYGYGDDALRFAFFSRAVVDMLPRPDFRPDVLHCNDWETAPAVLYLKNDQTWRADLRGVKTVYTIHNIAYQGQFSAHELENTFALPGGWYQGGLGYEYEGRHDINLMKGAMLMADAVSTVSATYARELHQSEFGQGLEGVVDLVDRKLYGILNGIDMALYDPATDSRIPANFNRADRAGKAACKAFVQEKFGIAVEPEWPLLCSVARLVEQKGIELIRQILPALMKMGVQLIVFGQGEREYIDYFNWARSQWPEQLGFSSDYTEQTAAELFAGADMYLMPSRFEPCGLSQMMAMRYGTVPIVHETGGLKDSVRPYSEFDGIGDGFSFVNYQPKALLLAVQEAVKLYFGDAKTFRALGDRCMAKDLSWDKSAILYERMYSDIVDIGRDDAELPFETAFARIKRAYEKLHRENVAAGAPQPPEDYHRSVQIQISGKGAGVFHIVFRGRAVEIEPTTFHGADVNIAASFDNLLGIAKGKISPDKLFMNGQLKVEGNVVKAAELRKMLLAPVRKKEK